MVVSKALEETVTELMDDPKKIEDAMVQHGGGHWDLFQ